MNKSLFISAFALGAIAVIWMATGFIGSDPLALAVTLVIGVVYVIGIAELLNFRRATASLVTALGSAGENTELDSWIAHLHPSLKNAVQLRIEGERVGLPAPIFSPYLVGLLVMLGLLGTFVGMVETLQGAVLALEGSTELAAIRSGLAAPIEGLGLAFGTSVAGVAASAMLGLNATLSRRERMLATRQLDSAISSVFRRHSLNYNRQQTFAAMQQQADALPQVAQQMAEMAQQLDQMGQRLEQTLVSNQASFLEGAQAQYRELAGSVDQSLKTSLADSGRLAGEAITPVVAQAMTTLNEQQVATRQQLADAVEQQLAGIGSRIEEGSGKVAGALEQALANQRSVNEQLVQGFNAHSTELAGKFETANSSLLHQLGETAGRISSDAESRSQESLQAIGGLLEASESLVQARIDTEKAWSEGHGERVAQLTATLDQALEKLRVAEEQRASASAQRQQQATVEMGAALQQLREAEEQRGIAADQRLQQLVEQLGNSLGKLHSLEEQRGETTQARLAQFAGELQAALQQLHSAEESRGEAAVARLGSLEETVTSHLATLGQQLEAPMTRLIETASETPRAAAEVIGKLRQEVSNNIERDNALLEERRQVMEQLNSLAASLEETSGNQQQAVVELVSSSQDLLREMGESLGDRVEGEVAKVADIAAEVSGSACEVAALGEAFSASVNLFGDSNDKLIESLQRIEQSLEQSSARSDDQMGYYVAQAREIIDQSMLSQREIIDELRRLGSTDDMFSAEAS